MCLVIHLLMSTIGSRSWASRAYVCVSISWTNSTSSTIPKSDIYKLQKDRLFCCPLNDLFLFLLSIYVSLSFFIKWRKVKRWSTPNSTVRTDVDSQNVSLHSYCKLVLSWKLLVSFARPLNNVELSTVKRPPTSPLLYAFKFPYNGAWISCLVCVSALALVGSFWTVF